MKLLLVLCFFAFATFCFAYPQQHLPGCIYIEEKCSEECEEGTHDYTPECGPITPEATCDEPHPKTGDVTSLNTGRTYGHNSLARCLNRDLRSS
ncbi:unnamed protein product [Arctia plantaginis]|uniref:Secreted protein n=1 Tax=Arctia plantaginis TaxID=874455 RepID=A0A8S0YYE4_ARCPL|nr:unnamed protein product [Arctia plantaginis]